MSVTLTISCTKEQDDFVKRNCLSPSKIYQKAVDEIRNGNWELNLKKEE